MTALSLPKGRSGTREDRRTLRWKITQSPPDTDAHRISTMKRLGRLVLFALVTVLVLLGLGYAWGVSGRGALESALDDTRQRLDVAEVRGHVLDARVSLYNMNFGDASRRLEEAKVPLRRIRQRYVDEGKDDAIGSISAAIEHLDEAQRLAGKLDQAANTKAGEALEAIRVATSR